MLLGVRFDKLELKSTINPRIQHTMTKNRDWSYRREVKSTSSNRTYIVAKNRTTGEWGCSCPGWIHHRTCKHLKALGKLECN
jgi:hypothetical protein